MPEFVDSTIHIVAGLLLPIWKRLPNQSTRVYWLQTDAGRAHCRQNGLGDMGRRRAGNGRRHSLFGRRLHRADGWQTVLDLSEGLQLRRVRVMGANRIELTGFTDAMRERLSAYGLFHEIISWKLRMFIPTDATGVAILAKVMERYPLSRICEREAA